MTAPTYEKLDSSQQGHSRQRGFERPLAGPRRPHRLPAARRRYRPRCRQRARNHHLRRPRPRCRRRQSLRRQTTHPLVRRSCRRRRPRTLSPAGQGRTGRLIQRGAAAPALFARRYPQGIRVLQSRSQGTAHHAHRRRLPQHQRLPAHALRPVRVRPPGSLFQGRRGAEQARGQGQYGHLPREHGRRVLRHRVQERHRQGQARDRAARGTGLHTCCPPPASASNQSVRKAPNASSAWPSASPSTRSCPASR